MLFDQYSSEEEALKVMIQTALNGHEERLMTLFIQQGPESLRSMLKIPNDYVWTVVFDHLVFNFDVLKRCVEMFFPFFKDYVLKNGPLALRDVFGIHESRYDVVFEKILDDMVIARGLLFDHIHEHIQDYLIVLEGGQGSDIRIRLGLVGDKYEPLWKDVLDFLLDAYSREQVKSKQKKDSQSFFSLLQSLLSE